MAASEDRTLGRAGFVTMRLTVFDSLNEELPLHPLHAALVETDHWTALCQPFRSFHNDIVVPHATASSLPLVMLCEPFQETDAPYCRPPRRLIVEFAPSMVMEWEGELIEARFCSDGHGLSVPAHVVDCITLFESGIVAYSLALMFGDEDADVDLNAQQLLAIGALVNSAGKLIDGAPNFIAEPGGPKSSTRTLHSFVQDRISTLAAGLDMFGETPSDCTPFTFLDAYIHSLQAKISSYGLSPREVVELDTYRRQALELHKSLKSLGLDAPTPVAENTPNHANPKVPATPSIGIEVIGAQWHDRVLDHASKANRREARVDDFTLRIAGLAQNVFDFGRQDIEEVNDSLSSAARIGTDITFAQRGTAIRFMEESRAFTDMHSVLGGSPYWLLVQLVLGHNERLLSELNAGLEVFRRTKGLHGMIRELLVYSPAAEGKIDDAVERLGRRFVRRMRLTHYIPNIFRYPTEQLQYELFSRARGLEAQRNYLVDLESTIEQTLETAAREAMTMGNRSFDVRLQLLLGAIGVLQVGGAVAALIAIWPKQGLLACLWHGSCGFYESSGSRVLLSLVVAAIMIGVLVGLGVAVSALRHRSPHWNTASNANPPLLRTTSS